MVDIMLFVTLILALFMDIKYHKIFNKFIYSVALTFFIYQTAANGILGLTYSLIGFLVGLVSCTFPYALRSCSLGEFKLLALIGLFKGYEFVITVSAVAYVIIFILKFVMFIVTGGFYRFILNGKLYIVLVMQYGISMSTIFEMGSKKVVIPYTGIVLFSFILIYVIKYIN